MFLKFPVLVSLNKGYGELEQANTQAHVKPMYQTPVLMIQLLGTSGPL